MRRSNRQATRGGTVRRIWVGRKATSHDDLRGEDLGSRFGTARVVNEPFAIRHLLEHLRRKKKFQYMSARGCREQVC